MKTEEENEVDVDMALMNEPHPQEAETLDKIVSWLEGRISELEAQAHPDSRIAGYIRRSAEERAHHYKDIVRGLREGAWKA